LIPIGGHSGARFVDLLRGGDRWKAGGEGWRVRVDLHEDGRARALTEHLGESALERDLDTSFDDRVVVSREGAGVFCYTGTRKQAQEAEALVHAVAANLGWHVDAELTRWHPSTGEWRNADEPLWHDDLERAAESTRTDGP
jgi:hypothetical protein